MKNIIQIKNLNKKFGNHEVLKDINFDVHKGEVVCVIGSSGSGKSTLLRCINLLEKPTGGQIIYKGENILDDKHDIYAYRTKLGMVFQQFYNMVDTVVVGKFLGVDALAGVGSTGSINFLVLGLWESPDE